MSPLARLVEQARLVKESLEVEQPEYNENLKQDLIDFRAESSEILKITMISLMRNITYSLTNQSELLNNLYFYVDDNGLTKLSTLDESGEEIQELSMHKATAAVWLDQQLLEAFKPDEIKFYLDGSRVNKYGQVFINGVKKSLSVGFNHE